MEKTPEKPVKAGKPLWRRILVGGLWLLLVLVLLIGGALTTVVAYLKPERLTPLVECLANEYLQAHVSLGRVELTFWSTWPRVELDVRDLRVVNDRWRQRPGASAMPQWGDSLLSIDRFHGAIDVLPLLTSRRISIYDILIHRPQVRIVQGRDSVCNYDIFPPSKDEEPFEMPDFSFRRFTITGGMPVRYLSVADGMDLSLNLAQLEARGDKAPEYSLKVQGLASADMGIKGLEIPRLRFGFQGQIDWDHNKPLSVSVQGLEMGLGGVSTLTSCELDFDRDLTVKSLDFQMSPTPVSRLVALVPKQWRGELDELRTAAELSLNVSLARPYVVGGSQAAEGRIEAKTEGGGLNTLTTCQLDAGRNITVRSMDFRLAQTPVSQLLALVPKRWLGELDGLKTTTELLLNVRLARPYVVGGQLPAAQVEAKIPAGTVNYEKLNLRDLSGYVNAYVDAANMDLSTVETRLNLLGQGVDLRVAGRGRDLASDPTVRGELHGRLDIARLPKKLLDKVPGKVTGMLTADCKFDLKKSYLTPRLLHKVYLEGEARLQKLDVNIPDFGATLYVGDLAARLGTASKWHNGSVSVDSLFTASLDIDTISAAAMGMSLVGSRLSAGIGSQNTATSTDTSQINPIGGRITAGRLVFQNASDSSRIRLRDVTIGGALRRYMGHGRKPLLDLRIHAGRAGYRDMLTRMNLRGMDAAVTLHPGLPRVGSRMKHRMDSISALHPDWPDEQVYEAAQKLRIQGVALKDRTLPDGQEIVDMQVDSGMRRILRTWDLKGQLTAERARVFTPYFPLRNTLTGLDMTFSTDSVQLRNTRLQSGASDFVVSGTISNIERALTSRTHKPLRLDFDLASDTIDVNQLAAAVFAGSAFGENAQSVNLGSSDDDEEIEKAVAAAAPIDSAAPLVVPMNVDGTLRFKANTVLYSDFQFHDMTGSLLMRDGQINLHQLAANTEVGSASLTALYSAPTRRDLSFAFGMQLKDFRINRVVKMVPALDTIMPLLRDISGIINADIAATSKLDSMMNLEIPSLAAAIKLSGDSLVLMDAETFRTLAKWLMFKNKKLNMIDHMSVEMLVDKGQLQLFPFMFNLDRYKLGVMGSNDLALNFNYHIGVLKSPLPFRFGVNISGNPDNYKIRLGGCKFNEKSPALSVAIADSTRINLLNQIENIFRRGVRNAPGATLRLGTQPPRPEAAPEEKISSSDSLYLRKQGLM